MPAAYTNPDRQLNGTPVSYVIERLAARLVRESGGTELKALADIKAAADKAIGQKIMMERLLDARSWAKIGRELGVSAQAAHRKYRDQDL